MTKLVWVAALVAAVAAGSAGDAMAAVSIVGAGYAKSCFEAAETNRPLREALRVCDNALEDDALGADDRAATFVNRGIVQMQARNLDAAIADYDAAIKSRPETAEAYINKGIALLHLGNRDEDAVKQLSEGLARNPTRPEIGFYVRGVANEAIGRTREAYEDYSRAAQLAPQWAEPAEQLQRFQLVRKKTAGV